MGKVKINKAELEDLYIVKQLTAKQISILYSCSLGAIIYNLKKNNIKLRTIKETSNLPQVKNIAKENGKKSKGRILSVDHKAKISKSLIKAYKEGKRRQIITEETKNKISEKLKNKPQSEELKNKRADANRGKKRTLEQRIKISKGIRKAYDIHPEYRETCKNSAIKRYEKPEERTKLRISRVKMLENKIGVCFPNYNPHACEKIDEYGHKHGYTFQHAMNGGEYYIKELGYSVDGYDKEKNTVIEYYEIAHNNKKRIQKDICRQKEIQNLLKCEFIILKEWEEKYAC